MDYVKDMAGYGCMFFFIVGFLCTVFNGSIKATKICLVVLAIIFSCLALAGLVFSKGLIIFLVPQLIVLYIVIAIFVVLGAAVGVFIDKLRKKSASTIKLNALDNAEYFSSAEFSSSSGVAEERIIQRIKSGFYKGGAYQNKWYVHKSELSRSG